MQERHETILLRSYKFSENAAPVSAMGKSIYDSHSFGTVTIKEAARATSAAPTYFPAETLDGTKAIFWDGGLLNNNPIDQLWRARLDLVSDDEPAPKVACVLSIGTSWAIHGAPTFWEKYKWLAPLHTALNWLEKFNSISKLVEWVKPAEESIDYLTNTEAKHMDFARYVNRVSNRTKDVDRGMQYFRFNTPTETYIDMANYKEMTSLAETTKTWMKDPSTAPYADTVAGLLAKKKKA
jgi:hypothetical protein